MLGSVFQTALSAISAAESAIQVSAHNVANAQTDGFKASRPVFTALSSQTVQTGEPPGESFGGTNPVQIGKGVRLAGVEADFSQGTIAHSADPLDLALEGPGFFVLEGRSGETVFSRDGNFHLDAARNLVTSTGDRVMGFNVDASFQLDTSTPEPVSIPSQRSPTGGELARFRVEHDGTIRGDFTDGLSHVLGRIEFRDFANPTGLVRREHNQFAVGNNSGLPTQSNARVVAGARELSNTDLGRELVNLGLYDVMFRANLRVLQTGDGMLEELMNLTRSR